MWSRAGYWMFTQGFQVQVLVTPLTFVLVHSREEVLR